MTFKTFLALLLCVCALLPFAGCALSDKDQGSSDDPAEQTEQNDTPQTTSAATESGSQEDNMSDNKVLVTIKVKGFGDIELELYPEVAPQSVCNFCSLARSGFYDGVIFHRVINGFMIQGGDPTGIGSGGPGYCIKGEFSANSVQNDLHHERGVISMARASYSYDSAGSQFFICQSTAGVAHLDGQYAAFGRVLTGMEVVDAIAAVETGVGNKPVEDVVIETITVNGPELPEPEKLPGR